MIRRIRPYPVRLVEQESLVCLLAAHRAFSAAKIGHACSSSSAPKPEQLKHTNVL